MQPNEPLGIISIHGLMKHATQSNLSSFHEAGLKSKDSVLPIQNILNVAKNDDARMVVDVQDSNDFKKKHLYRKFSYYVVQYKSALHLDPTVDSFWGMKSDSSLVRFYTNYRRLIEDCRTLEYIREILLLRKDLTIEISSDFVGIVDISEKYTTNEPMHRKISDILDIELGIEGVLEYSDNVTVGSNLNMVSRLDDIDHSTLWSNDIRQVESRFGIEAARCLIYDEIKNNCDNPEVIADYMAFYGKIHPFGKHNPGQESKGFLSSMSFEQPNYDIAKIGRSAIGDDITSVYSQTMIGMSPSNGTNNSNIRDF